LPTNLEISPGARGAHRKLLIMMRTFAFVWVPVSPSAAVEPLPSVVSINLCADQLVLSLAESQQIKSVSWLASDPEESMLAERAAAFPVNFGTAEEVLRLDPDVVIAGAYTNTFTRALLKSLGYTVVDIEPADSLNDIERNLAVVGAAVGWPERARRAVTAMLSRAQSIESRQHAERLRAIVVRPGGFTSGAGSLADTMMSLAGLVNVARAQNLDRWGSLSMETLLLAKPDLILAIGYRIGDASLANAALAHPALRTMRDRARSITLPGRYWACGLPESLESAEIVLDALAASPIRDVPANLGGDR
jgi:iron complex transport system substrate-binding protein